MKVFALTLAAAALAATSVNAASLEEQLGSALVQAVRQAAADAVSAQLEALSEMDMEMEAEGQMQVQVGGIQNCQNKCQNMFNNLQYMVGQASSATGGNTYEYLACIAGCDICDKTQAKNETNWATCFTVCKDTDWNSARDANGNVLPIVKGVIEPDKACQMGCTIQLCQVACQGGTTDNAPTPTNAPAWWGSGVGCSIKTGSYSQNPAYNNPNGPVGPGGVTDCCAQAFSLCNYPQAAIPSSPQNYQNVVDITMRFCKNVPGAGQTVDSVCTFFKDPANCGSSL